MMCGPLALHCLNGLQEGILTKMLFAGQQCNTGFAKTSPSLSSEKWSAEYAGFVGKCLVRDVNKRWSVKQLMEVSDWEMA